VGRSEVSAMTHTPASGPFALVTVPPISSASIFTSSARWPMARGAVKSAATVTARTVEGRTRAGILMKTSSMLTIALKELKNELADPFRLLLLNPVTGVFDEVHARHPRARGLRHPLERAGILIRAPVALAGDEHRRLIDGAPGQRLEVR